MRLHRLWSIDFLWLLILATLLILQFWFPFSGPGRVNDTYSVEINGRRALYELAEQRFGTVRRNHQPLAHALPRLDKTSEALCLLGPARYPTADEWQALLKWVSSGGRLLAAAELKEGRGFEIPGLNARVNIPEATPEEAVKAMIKPGGARAAGVHSRMLSQRPEIRWLSTGTIVAPQAADVLVDGDAGPQAVRIRYGQGWIVLLASDYIFTNESLNRTDSVNPYLAWRLLRSVAGNRGLVFDESLNAAAQPTIESLLMSDPLRPATLQLCILLVVFAWSGTHRFGALLPKTTKPRHDIADHTDALGNLYFKRNDAAGTLKRYLDQWRMELRLGAQRKDAPQVERFARRTGRSAASIRRLVTDAEAAVVNPRLTRRDAARMIARLAEFRTEVNSK